MLGFTLPAPQCGNGLCEQLSYCEPIRATGPVAFVNPFRFSTKYCDDETGHYYYGYRYYSPTQGRWLSRDPLNESGGLHLYVFCGNDPVNFIDPLGLDNTGYHPLYFISQVYNNAPTALHINIELPLAPPEMSADLRDVNIPTLKPEPPRLHDSTIINPHYIESDWSHAWIEYEGNDPVFDLPRVFMFNYLCGIFQGLASPLRYMDALDDRLPTEEQHKSFSEATIGVSIYLLPVVCKKIISCEGMASGKGLITPSKYFGNKTAQEVSEAMMKKFGPPKSFRKGAETFYNPKTRRSFNIHTDPDHGPPHVDVRRRGGYVEKKYALLEGQ